jgi:glycosyltransferase involved in cell wall biosynthesis
LYEIFSRSSTLVRSISPSSVSIRDLAPATGARFDKEDLRLLYVGRLQRAKGLEELFEAISKATDERHRFELDIVGGDAHGGSYLRLLRARVAELGLDGAVRFHGHVAFGGGHAFRSSDVFVPSFSEGRPKEYEAMIAGSVIATGQLAFPIIGGEVTGRLVDFGDVDGLAAC